MWTTARRQRTPVVVRAALLAAALITVAGLLAMHALSLHGTGADGEHGALSLPAAHVGHAHSVEHADHDATGHIGHPGGDGHTTMMLCAAFLLAAGVLILSGLLRRTSGWFGRARGWARVTGSAPVVSHLATGPPSVWAYSVIRC